MPTIGGYERGSDDLLEEITEQNVEAVRPIGLDIAITFLICHPDIPEGIPLGTFYYKGPFGPLRKKVAADVSECIRNLEAGISEEGRSALSPDSDGSAVPGAPVAKSGVVPGRRVR